MHVSCRPSVVVSPLKEERPTTRSLYFRKGDPCPASPTAICLVVPISEIANAWLGSLALMIERRKDRGDRGSCFTTSGLIAQDYGTHFIVDIVKA